MVEEKEEVLEGYHRVFPCQLPMSLTELICILLPATCPSQSGKGD
jgi:hypothetical protein